MKISQTPDGKRNRAGKYIKEERERKEWTQEQLAAKVQIEGGSLTQKAISRMETGERIVTDLELILLAEVMDVSVLTLAGMEISIKKKNKGNTPA